MRLREKEKEKDPLALKVFGSPNARPRALCAVLGASRSEQHVAALAAHAPTGVQPACTHYFRRSVPSARAQPYTKEQARLIAEMAERGKHKYEDAATMARAPRRPPALGANLWRACLAVRAAGPAHLYAVA